MADEREGYCINCNQIVSLAFGQRRFTLTVKGIPFSYPEEYAICGYCGSEKVYVPSIHYRFEEKNVHLIRPKANDIKLDYDKENKPCPIT